MKKNIILVLVTAIIFTGIGVFATTALTASQISYDENNTVKDKIDDLYKKTSNLPIDIMDAKCAAIDHTPNYYRHGTFTVPDITDSLYIICSSSNEIRIDDTIVPGINCGDLLGFDENSNIVYYSSTQYTLEGNQITSTSNFSQNMYVCMYRLK